MVGVFVYEMAPSPISYMNIGAWFSYFLELSDKKNGSLKVHSRIFPTKKSIIAFFSSKKYVFQQIARDMQYS